MTRCAIHLDAPEMTCHVCHAAALATHAAQEGRVSVAEQVFVNFYADELDAIRIALELDRWLVTDESCVSDFSCLGFDPARRLREAFEVRVHRSDLLVEIARRIRRARSDRG